MMKVFGMAQGSSARAPVARPRAKALKVALSGRLRSHIGYGHRD